MADDLRRMEYTPGNCYNFHPGSHVGQGAEAGIAFIADMLNQILKRSSVLRFSLKPCPGKEARWAVNSKNCRRY